MKKIKKIFDKEVDCYCNIDDSHCDYNCKCYCHIPKWYKNMVWKIQDIKVVGHILIVMFLFFFSIPMTIYLVFFGYRSVE